MCQKLVPSNTFDCVENTQFCFATRLSPQERVQGVPCQRDRTMAAAEQAAPYLGTLGGALLGREGTWGGAPWPSALGNGGSAPGRNGTGGAPDCGPGDGMAGAGPRPDKGLVGGLFSVGLLGVEGLGGGDLVK